MADNRFFNTIKPLSIKEVAFLSGCQLEGTFNSNLMINGVAPIDTAGVNDITFLSNKKYAAKLPECKASACILSKDSAAKAPNGMALLISENAYASYAKIATVFYPDDKYTSSISPAATIAKSANIGEGCTIEATAYIGENAQIGKNSFIAPGVYVGKGVKIGDNCRIMHACTLTHTIIGNNVFIHPGVRIGQDGFGFATDKGVHIKVPQLGRVIIEDNVEIGANTCIDRGAGPDTIIGAGTKIDNLVQIGHNVQTGRGCIIVSQVGISGSTKLGDYVVLGGQVGVAGHLNIGSMATVAAQSGIAQDIEAKETVGGSPAVPIKQWHRQTIALKKLVNK